MRVAALTDVLKVVLYVIASFLLAALISPYLYEIGKGFAHFALRKDTVDQVAWLAIKAEGADFHSYFRRAFLISALICFFPLFYSLDLKRHARQRVHNPWTVGLPPSSTPPRMGQVLQKKSWGALQALTIFSITTGLCLIFVWILLTQEWLTWKTQSDQPPLWSLILSSLKSALIFSVIEEVLFRGALLGIFLRAFPASLAIINLSLLFAAIHFLTQADHLIITNPRDPAAGFEILSLICQKCTVPDALILSFIPLFVAGLVLGWARYRSSALWLPIGLHSAWIFSYQFFSHLTQKPTKALEKYYPYLGNTLKEGLAPVILLTVTTIITIIFLKFSEKNRGNTLEE